MHRLRQRRRRLGEPFEKELSRLVHLQSLSSYIHNAIKPIKILRGFREYNGSHVIMKLLKSHWRVKVPSQGKYKHIG